MSAQPIFGPVEGSPYQPGQMVRIVAAVDKDAHDVTDYIGRVGSVEYLEYSCGCGQTFPCDPMIGVRFDTAAIEEFWAEELTALVAARGCE